MANFFEKAFKSVLSFGKTVLRETGRISAQASPYLSAVPGLGLLSSLGAAAGYSLGGKFGSQSGQDLWANVGSQALSTTVAAAGYLAGGLPGVLGSAGAASAGVGAPTKVPSGYYLDQLYQAVPGGASTVSTLSGMGLPGTPALKDSLGGITKWADFFFDPSERSLGTKTLKLLGLWEEGNMTAAQPVQGISLEKLAKDPSWGSLGWASYFYGQSKGTTQWDSGKISLQPAASPGYSIQSPGSSVPSLVPQVKPASGSRAKSVLLWATGQPAMTTSPASAQPPAAPSYPVISQVAVTPSASPGPAPAASSSRKPAAQSPAEHLAYVRSLKA